MLQTIQSKKGALRSTLTFCLTGLCVGLLVQHLATVDLAQVQTALQDIRMWQWALALCATAISFIAVGQYDVVWHRQLETGVPNGRARSSGMAAIAVGQTVGLGALTGTFVRWHLLRGQSLKSAAAVSIAVSLSFLGCWSLFAASAALYLGLISVAQAAIVAVCIILAVGVIFTRSKSAPRLQQLGMLITLTAIDIGFAGIALWILMPTTGASVFLVVITAYVLALGAGLISNAPGGVGAFELVLLGLISTVSDADILAGVIGFRIAYYLLPALSGGGLMLRAHLKTPSRQTRPTLCPATPHSDLCHQGANLMSRPTGSWVVRRHLLGTVAIEPAGNDITWQPQILGFRALYKCGRRQAALARRAGWHVRLIAQNAIIVPATWTESGSSRSGLRRKLKQAQKAGVTVTRACHPLPICEMDRVAAMWSNHNNGELGYAMGRYTQTYVKQQQVYLIWHNAQLCGFVTVQTRADEWGLDLIRHMPCLPSGAMHSALNAVIQDAKQADVQRLSLGAVPDGPSDARIQRLCVRHKTGLRQFKSSFQPKWEPRYHAAPSKHQWVLSMMIICGHVQRPLRRGMKRMEVIVKYLMKKARIIHLPHNPVSVIEQ